MLIAACLFSAVLADATPACLTQPKAATVSVDIGDVRAEVPRTIYGTCMEDVNHEIYGGLDAQRLYDESFEETMPPLEFPDGRRRKKRIYRPCGRQWTDVSEGGGIVRQDESVAHWGVRSQLLKPGAGLAGVANCGLNGWGVPCREGRKMTGALYVRGSAGRLEVKLQRRDGRVTYASRVLEIPRTNDWRKVGFELVPDTTDSAARFLVVASGGGALWIDDAYLVDEPTNAFGRMGCREDIVDAFVKEGVTFLRWGGTMVNAPEYLLKNMTGERRPYEGWWFRTSSGGFMVREFVQMADLMKLPCAFSINAYYESENNAAELAAWLRRFKGFVCVQIGNEECEGATPYSGRLVAEDVRRYCTCVRRLVGAMRKENERLFFAGALTWQPSRMDLMEEAFRTMDGFIDYWDIHVNARSVDAGEGAAAKLRDFRAMVARINPKSTMKAAIFEENANSHDMGRALAHASILEAVREQGDFLLTSCQANALQAYAQNDNGWDQGQIFYTTDKVWFQPSGWAQRMARENHRDVLVAGRTDDGDVTVSATRDKDGCSVVLHLCNRSNKEKTVRFAFSGAGSERLVLAKATALSASCLQDCNPPDDPCRISPKDTTDELRSRHSLRPYSYTVVEFQKDSRGANNENVLKSSQTSGGKSHETR